MVVAANLRSTAVVLCTNATTQFARPRHPPKLASATHGWPFINHSYANVSGCTPPRTPANSARRTCVCHGNPRQANRTGLFTYRFVSKPSPFRLSGHTPASLLFSLCGPVDREGEGIRSPTPTIATPARPNNPRTPIRPAPAASTGPLGQSGCARVCRSAADALTCTVCKSTSVIIQR